MHLRGSRANLLVMAAVYLTFGVSMVVTPSRWSQTPAYGAIFRELPERDWAVIYLVVGGLLLAAALWMADGSRKRYVFAMASITLGLMVSVSWMLAFIVRVLTNPSTTPETFMSFLVFSYLLVRVAILLDDEARVMAPHGRR